MISSLLRVSSSLGLGVLLAGPFLARAGGHIGRVNHVVILIQENHSFDNYFGALPYVPGGPYHPGPCAPNDHACVDGLACSRSPAGVLTCTNGNRDDDGSRVTAFHSRNYCPGPDLRHDWPASHQEANFTNPGLTFLASPNDGFVRVNDRVPGSIFPILDGGDGQPDASLGGESRTEDDTMGFFDQGDLPFYYALAQTFAIGDRYFSSVMGPTFPNRSYLLAATSFGHLSTLEIAPPPPGPEGYRPITGTIMDLLDRAGVSWLNFFFDGPTTAIFRGLDPTHLRPLTSFFAIATEPTCTLPEVSFVDPAFGNNTLGTNPNLVQFDEHPPTDIRAGQFFVSQVVQALRASPCWKDSVLFITYDEHGGFYDHVAPPRAKQGGSRTPDGIAPGQCADASSPPGSEAPGGGAQCFASVLDAPAICPGFTPTGRYPFWCASFDQLGFRVPFMAVSPFSRPHHVSHVVADHTSLLAFIEKRFLSAGEDDDDDRPALTARDRHASTLEDLFDFEHAPSLDAPVPGAPAPLPNDPGCPFVPPAH
jgi:phospholipase C